MRDHKFKIGQTLEFQPGARDQATSRGRYEIVRLLPPEGFDNQYRVKSALDGHERVVKESQLG
jgi:hypothetical protein